MTNSINNDNIRIAQQSIDPVFINTPQYQSESLSQLLGASLVLKVETINPLGCFKGRGADWWVKTHQQVKKLVCVSAGNFGLAMAYAGRRQGMEVHVFSIEKANLIKIAAIEQLGAKIHLLGNNYDIVRAAAKNYAEENDCYFIVDGKEAEITEGAGTIGIELAKYPQKFDVLYIPVGDGALISGIGAWFKTYFPQTKIVGVCAKGAPAMYQSWKKGHIISTDQVETIADGIAINTPITEAYELLVTLIDELTLIDDSQTVRAMQLLYEKEHLITEPAGAVALAAAMANAKNNQHKTIGVILTGANINPVNREKWLQGAI